ncbi:MAG: hypothetical protein ABIJ97_17540 [Bacteroidota bacterium]
MKLTGLKLAIKTAALAVAGVESFMFGTLADINESDTQEYDLFLLLYPSLTGKPYTKGYKQKNYQIVIYLFRKFDADLADKESRLATGFEELQTEIDSFITNLIADNTPDIAISDLNFDYDYGKIGSEVLQWVELKTNFLVNDC